ncbi:hypothetical protein [Faecalibacillus intestinalis]|uniref:hypothetical protein n=1 Tax=Faecalibacillus intestinalis TaxID=1982626 RepID=UPI0039938209
MDKTIKVFISQPMANRSEEEILNERLEVLNKLKKDLKTDNIAIIDSYFEEDEPKSTIHKGVYHLGKSLELLSTADVAYFCKGWQHARGCLIEKEVCQAYNILTYIDFPCKDKLKKYFMDNENKGELDD